MSKSVFLVKLENGSLSEIPPGQSIPQRSKIVGVVLGDLLLQTDPVAFSYFSQGFGDWLIGRARFVFMNKMGHLRMGRRYEYNCLFEDGEYPVAVLYDSDGTGGFKKFVTIEMGLKTAKRVIDLISEEMPDAKYSVQGTTY